MPMITGTKTLVPWIDASCLKWDNWWMLIWHAKSHATAKYHCTSLPPYYLFRSRIVRLTGLCMYCTFCSPLPTSPWVNIATGHHEAQLQELQSFHNDTFIIPSKQQQKKHAIKMSSESNVAQNRYYIKSCALVNYSVKGAQMHVLPESLNLLVSLGQNN